MADEQAAINQKLSDKLEENIKLKKEIKILKGNPPEETKKATSYHFWTDKSENQAVDGEKPSFSPSPKGG